MWKLIDSDWKNKVTVLLTLKRCNDACAYLILKVKNNLFILKNTQNILEILGIHSDNKILANIELGNASDGHLHRR